LSGLGKWYVTAQLLTQNEPLAWGCGFYVCACICIHTHAEYVFFYIIEMTWMAGGNAGVQEFAFWKTDSLVVT